jgi:aryl-alcohol dehydrogenase-like predicted oxidoreductase
MHCSDEYESFPFLLEVLLSARSVRPNFTPQFVVKLAEPHFGSSSFDTDKFHERLHNYREALGVDRLDCVQWMWRGDLQDEDGRLRSFSESADAIERAFEDAKERGSVRSIRCFPYTMSFADMAIGHPSIDGIAVYRNPLELEYEPLVARAQRLDKGVLVIRPLKAGEALAASHVRDLVGFSARVRAVDGIVVSCSSFVHLRECVEAAASC